MNFEFMTIDTPLPPCMPFPRARCVYETGQTPCTKPKSRLTGQTPSVWKIFSVHRERHVSKADENTAGKNTTA